MNSSFPILQDNNSIVGKLASEKKRAKKLLSICLIVESYRLAKIMTADNFF